MRRPEFVTNVLLIGGVILAGAFDGPILSETRANSGIPVASAASKIKIPGCRIIQSRVNEIKVICPYLDNPEEEIDRIEWAVEEVGRVCGDPLWVDTYRHRTLTFASIITPDQNCLGPDLGGPAREIPTKRGSQRLHPLTAY